MRLGDGKVLHCIQTMTWRHSLTLLHLKTNILQCTNLIPCKVSPNLHQLHNGKIGQFNTHSFLLPFTQWLMSYAQNQKIQSYVVVRTWLLLQASVGCRGCAMFILSNFGITWRHVLAWNAWHSFFDGEMQFRNMPLWLWTLWLQHVGGIGDHILIVFKWLDVSSSWPMVGQGME